MTAPASVASTRNNRIVVAMLVFAAWSLLSVLFATQAFVASHYVSRPMGWGHAFGTAFLAWYLRGIFAIATYWLAMRVPFRAHRVGRALLVHVPASLLAAVLHQALYVAIVVNVTWFRGVLPSPAELQMSIVVYWIVVGVAHGARYYAAFRHSELTAARLQSQLAGARLDLLRSQLQPHFLFNTLNDIAELMHEDTERADTMLTSLSELLRSSLRDPTAREIPLGEELAFLQRYLDIIKMRWQDRLQVEVDVAAELARLPVPSLILQPLVENAVRHGIGNRGAPLVVRIVAERVGNRLRLTVSDNGSGLRDASSAPGLGLRNTRDRLHEHFGGDFRLELVEIDGGGVRAVIEIPAGAPVARSAS